MALKYVGEWLTLDQAASVLGISRAELKPLWEAGEIVIEQLYPGAWRARTESVYDLASSPAWKREHGA